ncbi:hypothetical protein JAAARDRAFT_205101 [Jaapia argillacea MUCL 33604]|uniref:RING-type domain-containing protein n=1 Tax=Jaapia argillacea MUCL 33604 TaxID=933084 RepID=A0A067PZ07_9AGAM|nr:hypothetical protein JAAARDRAFT_205101 [Jaapia argillacea MUCL 33604]
MAAPSCSTCNLAIPAAVAPVVFVGCQHSFHPACLPNPPAACPTCDWHRRLIRGAAGAAAGICLAPIIAPAALGIVGFGAAGPVAGTLAAVWQASIGNVAAGSAFALCQSVAAGGALPMLGFAAGAAAGAAAGVGTAETPLGSGGGAGSGGGPSAAGEGGAKEGGPGSGEGLGEVGGRDSGGAREDHASCDGDHNCDDEINPAVWYGRGPGEVDGPGPDGARQDVVSCGSRNDYGDEINPAVW